MWNIGMGHLQQNHGYQSNSCIIKCNDNKFMTGTSDYAGAELESIPASV